MVGVVAIVLVVALAFAVAANGGKTKAKNDADRSPADAALVAAVTSIPPDVVSTVGSGTARARPTKIDAPALTADGKPLVLYVGAEYCPFCATQRWPMIIALSRFGTFTGLQTTHSASDDVYPDTETLSFYGATYASNVVAFQAVELQTNTRAPLETLTPAQEQIVNTYDGPPYLSSSSKGTIPFVDFGGRYVLGGASYDAGVLSGKTAQQIATALSDPNTAIAKGAVGTANAITAAICNLTAQQPASVCSMPVIARIADALR